MAAKSRVDDFFPDDMSASIYGVEINCEGGECKERHFEWSHPAHVGSVKRTQGLVGSTPYSRHSIQDRRRSHEDGSKQHVADRVLEHVPDRVPEHAPDRAPEHIPSVDAHLLAATQGGRRRAAARFLVRNGV